MANKLKHTLARQNNANRTNRRLIRRVAADWERAAPHPVSPTMTSNPSVERSSAPRSACEEVPHSPQVSAFNLAQGVRWRLQQRRPPQRGLWL
jgi:hypothetical protein